MAGTVEDEFLKNVKNAIEPQLLKICVQLDNGQTGKVYKMVATEKGGLWRCHVCNFSAIGARAAYYHNVDPSHVNKMKLPTHPAQLFRDKTPPLKPQQSFLELTLDSGEPVPPGEENEPRRGCYIQKQLDAYDAPLIGLEYVIELRNTSSETQREPSYICILCDKRGDPRTVMAHLVSYNHRLKVIEAHFPKVNGRIIKYKHQKEYRRGCQNVVATLAQCIENRFGRLLPRSCDRDSFEKNRIQFTQTIVSDVHFHDKHGETLEEFVYETLFVDCVDQHGRKKSPTPPRVKIPSKGTPKKLPHASKRVSTSPLSGISSSSLSSGRSQSPPDRRSFARRRDFEEKNKKRFRRDGESPRGRVSRGSPTRKPRFGGVKDAKRSEMSRWDEYNRGIVDIEKDMERKLRYHEKNPEKHPHYPDEWKKFWNRRYKELQADNKDPTTHDFKPEWIVVWNKRMKELHDDELKAKCDDLRKRLRMTDIQTTRRPIKFKVAPKDPLTMRPIDNDVIIIDDKDSPPPSPRFRRNRESYSQSKRSRSRSRTSMSPVTELKSPFERVSRSPFRDNIRREYAYGAGPHFVGERPVGPTRVPYRPQMYPTRSIRYEPGMYPPFHPSYYPPTIGGAATTSTTASNDDEDDKDPTNINVVSVLRLLTALEDKLGSHLGPKCIDLLANALAMEKAEANSSDALLDNESNCILFETVKEKLKGQQQAGLVEKSAERAVKRVIRLLASLLWMSSERQRKRDEAERERKVLGVAGVGEVDRAAVAAQIAAALIAQGRTDVTQEELERLINAVVGVTKKHVPFSLFDDAKKTRQTELSEMLTKSTTDAAISRAMESLTDDDLQTLLQNFKNLDSNEQHKLISYLKTLEAKEPERVERLRKFVNLEENAKVTDATKSREVIEESEVISSDDEDVYKVDSPAAVPDDEARTTKITSESDEDDYSYDDVFEAASKNVNERKMTNERKIVEDSLRSTRVDDKKLDPEAVLNETKLVIANLMDKFGTKTSTDRLNRMENAPKPVTIDETQTNVPPVVDYEFTATSSSQFQNQYSDNTYEGSTENYPQPDTNPYGGGNFDQFQGNRFGNSYDYNYAEPSPSNVYPPQYPAQYHNNFNSHAPDKQQQWPPNRGRAWSQNNQQRDYYY